jgi:UDP-glucose 4-epimerase
MTITDAIRDSKILVTGAGGFIGGHVAAALAQVTCRLVLLDTVPGAVHRHGPTRAAISWHETSIVDPAFTNWLQTERFDFIFHFAGNANVATSVSRPEYDIDVNLRASVAILEAIRQAECHTTILYASSAAVYGEPSRLPIAESDPTVPISPYGVGKLAMERYLAVYCKLYGLRGASVRMFSPFGPFLRKQIVFDLMQRIRSRPAALEVYGDGTQTRDFIFIDDVVAAILHVVARGPLDGTTYNVARGAETTVSELADRLRALMDPNLPVRYLCENMPGYPDHWRADIGRIQALGWAPQVTLAAGLIQTVGWFDREHP